MARNIDFDLSSDSFDDKFAALDQRWNADDSTADYLNAGPANEPEPYASGSKTAAWNDDDFEKRFQAKFEAAVSEPELSSKAADSKAAAWNDDDFEKRFQAKFEAAVSEPELSSKAADSKAAAWNDDDFEKRFQAKFDAAVSEPESYALSSKAAGVDDFSEKFQAKLDAAVSEPEPLADSAHRLSDKVPESKSYQTSKWDDDDFEKKFSSKLDEAANEPESLAGSSFEQSEKWDDFEKKYRENPNTSAADSYIQREPVIHASESASAKPQSEEQTDRTQPTLTPIAGNSPKSTATRPVSQAAQTKPAAPQPAPAKSGTSQPQAAPKVSKNRDLERFMSAAAQNNSSAAASELPFATVRTQKLEHLKKLINDNREYLKSLETNSPVSDHEEDDNSDSIELMSEWFDDDDKAFESSNSEWLSSGTQTSDTSSVARRRQPNRIKPLADPTSVESEISSASVVTGISWLIAIPLAIILIATAPFFMAVACIIVAIIIHKKNGSKQKELFKSRIVPDVLRSYFNATHYRHSIQLTSSDAYHLRNFGVAKNSWQNGIISDAFDGFYAQSAFNYYDVSLNNINSEQIFHGQLLEITVPRIIQQPFAIQTRFTVPSRMELEQMRAFGFITQTHADLLKKFSFHPSYDNDIKADKSYYVTLNDIDLPDLFSKLEQLSNTCTGLVYFRYWKDKMYFSIQRTYDPFELNSNRNGDTGNYGVQQIAINDAREIAAILDTLTNIIIM